MVIDAITRDECIDVLAHAPVARLACAADNQPYVVPVFLAHHRADDGDDWLYGFTTPGQKVAWMRKNPLVCVEVDKVVNRSEWESVVAFGHYLEIENVHEAAAARLPTRHDSAYSRRRRETFDACYNEQLLAHQLLEARAMWWEPAASVRTDAPLEGQPGRILPVFYKIRLTDVSGFRCRHECEAAVEEVEVEPQVPPAELAGIRGLFRRWFALRGNSDVQAAHA